MSTKWIDLSGLRIFKELQDSQNDNKYAFKEDIPSIEDLDISSLVTKEELGTGLGSKQDTLVSGNNIKTINGQSVLGEGDILINSAPTEEELYELSITLVDSNPGWGHYNDYIVLTTEEVDAILGSDKFVINLGGDDVIFYKYERYSDEEAAYSAFSNNNQIIFYCYKNSWSDEHEASIYTNYHYSPYKASEYNDRLYDDLYGIDGDIVVSVSDLAYGNVPCVLTETEDGLALSYVYSAVVDGNDSIVKGKLTVDSNNNTNHTYDIIANASLLDLTNINSISYSGATYEYISNHLNNPIYVKDSGWDYSSDQKNSKYDMIAPATVSSYDTYTYLGVTYNNCFIIEYAFNGYMRHVIACVDRTIKSPRRTYILRLTEPLPQVGSSISGSWGDSNNVGSADQINIVYDNGSHTSLMSVFVDKQYQIQETISALFLGGFDSYTNTQTYYRLTSSSGGWGISAYEVAFGSGAELTSESIIEALGYTPQESITDLENIRTGAALGSTALQASDISGKLDKAEAASTYISKTDATSAFASKNDLSSKQDTITDLNDIRTNANKSSQAMQMVENLTAVVNENEEVAARAISDIYAKLETTPGDSGSNTSNEPVILDITDSTAYTTVLNAWNNGVRNFVINQNGLYNSANVVFESDIFGFQWTNTYFFNDLERPIIANTINLDSNGWRDHYSNEVCYGWRAVLPSNQSNIELNQRYLYDWNGSSLTITFAQEEISENSAEYGLIIHSGSAAPTVSFPSTVMWADGLSDVIDGVFVPQSNCEYQIHIIQKKYATYLKYKA